MESIEIQFSIRVQYYTFRIRYSEWYQARIIIARLTGIGDTVVAVATQYSYLQIMHHLYLPKRSLITWQIR